MKCDARGCKDDAPRRGRGTVNYCAYHQAKRTGGRRVSTAVRRGQAARRDLLAQALAVGDDAAAPAKDLARSIIHFLSGQDLTP